MPYQRDYERRVRIGVVGVGSHSYLNLLPTLTYLPVELVAIADVSEAAAAATAKQYAAKAYTSTSDMYASEDLDAVLLCVSPQLHPRLAIEAFEADLHVWMEKPVGTGVADVDRMIAARGDRICVVGYKKAFMPAAVKAREILALPEFGKLHTLTGTYAMNIPRGDRDFIARGENSRWLVDGCHPTSLLLSLGGAPTAVATHRADDGSGVLVIRHESGAITSLHLAESRPMFQPYEQFTLIGDGQSIEIYNSRKLTYQRGVKADRNGTTFAPEGFEQGAIVWEAQDSYNTLENKAVVTQGMWGELDYFLGRILTAARAEFSGLEFARQVMQVYEAAVLSDDNMVGVDNL